MSDPWYINIGQGDLVGTATIATDGTFTITAHGLTTGQAVRVTNLTGGATAQLRLNTVYYVLNTGTDTFRLLASPGDTIIAFGSAGGADVFTAVPRYAADELRRAQGMFLYSDTSIRFGARSGVHPSNNPAVTIAGTTWTVEDIRAVVHPGLTSQAGAYVVQHPSESGALDPADSTNPRIDGLDLQVQDDDEDSSGFRRARVVYVAGTPAASPAAPALTTSSLRLATILVPSGGTPSPTVETLAVFTVSTGGVLPVRDATELPTLGVYEGMAAFQQDTNALVVHDGTAFVSAGNTQGFQFGGRVIYTANGTFDKGDFPGLRAVDVQAQGGGGAGGGAPITAVGEGSAGSGGEGGAYARSFVLVDDLGASETVNVGAGGTGVTSGTGNNGGTSTFVVSGPPVNVAAAGGAGGATLAANANVFSLSGAESAQAMTGDIQIAGGGGGHSQRNTTGSIGGIGGPSHLGNGGRGTGQNVSGADGNGFGGGGGGAANGSDDAAKAGGNGSAGVVTVGLYY